MKCLGFACSAMFLAMVVPAPAQMAPQPTQTITGALNGVFNMDWYGINGRTYFVQWSVDLVSWQYMPVIERGANDVIGYGFDGDVDKMFIRLHYTDIPTITPHSDDFDGDGISNWDEVRTGGTNTSPFLADTNGDGIRDDGLVFAALSDPDGASMAQNLQEGLVGRWDFESSAGFPEAFSSTPVSTGAALSSQGASWQQDGGMPSHCAALGGNGYLSLPESLLDGADEVTLLNMDKNIRWKPSWSCGKHQDIGKRGTNNGRSPTDALVYGDQ